jgi:hypothetical protein
MNEQSFLDMLSTQDISSGNDFLVILFNFGLCVLMSFILKSFYIEKSFSLTGKMHIGPILPILSTVVFLVIVVVKSSLALSLGLVGALSIVRFRTPIKEPEELVYLFLAIAIGLGYAAGQTLLTTLIFLSIIFINYFWSSNNNQNLEYNIVISWRNKDLSFEKMTNLISNSVDSIKLIRLEYGDDINTAVLMISLKEAINIESLSKNLLVLDKHLTVSFYESKTNW